jgi:hypothetical protein
MPDKMVLIKLSTLESYIYHIGNRLDDVGKDYKNDPGFNKIDSIFL